MGLRRYFRPASTILASHQETRALCLYSLVIFLFCRLILLWGFHNLFHLTYLLIAFTFFQVTIMPMQITRNMALGNMMTELTEEEHAALRSSSVLLGYIWSILLYVPIAVVWMVDIQQVQAGVEWQVSNYVPDPISFAVILSFCV